MDNFLKKYLRFNGAIINDKPFNANTKMRMPKLSHPVRENVNLGDDLHPHIKVSWEEAKKEIIPEDEDKPLKGKDLLKKIYQGGKKISASEILDKIEKTDNALIKHLEGHIKRGDADKEDYKQSKILKQQIPEEIQYIPANKAKKNSEIWKWSNPITAYQQAKKFYNKDLYISNRKNKKYMIQDTNGKWVSFGQLNYKDFTKTGDQNRRENYLRRASNIKGDWRSNPYSPNALSMRILW